MWGRTPLHWAVTNGHRAAVVALMGAGSDAWLKDSNGESAMDLAEKRAECREWLGGTTFNGGACDRMTLQLLQMMTG
jgi:hypothetical protein